MAPPANCKVVRADITCYELNYAEPHRKFYDPPQEPIQGPVTGTIIFQFGGEVKEYLFNTDVQEDLSLPNYKRGVKVGEYELEADPPNIELPASLFIHGSVEEQEGVVSDMISGVLPCPILTPNQEALARGLVAVARAKARENISLNQPKEYIPIQACFVVSICMVEDD